VPLLDVRDLSVRYGATVAVDHVSLAVDEGAIVGLIGPNGAGKTSLIDALSGFTEATGTITFGGVALHRMRAHDRARAGLVRTWQSIELFDDLTVREVLAVAEGSQRAGWSLRRRPPPKGPGHTDVAARLGLGDILARRPSALSHGQRKIVGLARALAASPRLLLADEPAAGLDTAESAVLATRLREIVAEGAAMLLVDHDMGLVLNVCDWVYVIDFGRLIAAGPPSAIRTDPAVIAAYLGDDGGLTAGGEAP
jgi:branched-chain amino acid transport system ATP-binding protein